MKTIERYVFGSFLSSFLLAFLVLSFVLTIGLLVQIVDDGMHTDATWTITEARDRCRNAIRQLDPAITRFLNPQKYPVGLEMGLARLRHDLAQEELSGSGRTNS